MPIHAAGSALIPREQACRIYTLRPTPCTLHPTPYTLHPTPYTLHPTACTLHLSPYSLHALGCRVYGVPIHTAGSALIPREQARRRFIGGVFLVVLRPCIKNMCSDAFRVPGFVF